MTKIEGLSAIEKPVGTMKILLFLHRNKKATITSLLRRGNLNQRTTYSALEKLQKEGLIFQEMGEGFPLCKYYLLTDKGQTIAEKLDGVAALLAS